MNDRAPPSSWSRYPRTPARSLTVVPRPAAVDDLRPAGLQPGRDLAAEAGPCRRLRRHRGPRTPSAPASRTLVLTWNRPARPLGAARRDPRRVAADPGDHRRPPASGGPVCSVCSAATDDFLIRPFVPDELPAWIRLVAAGRGWLPAPTVLVHRRVPGRRRRPGLRRRPLVALFPTDALLVALAETGGDVATHDELARRAWSEPVSANLVQVYLLPAPVKIGPDRIRPSAAPAIAGVG
ncbi:DNA-binding response regulator [Pseudonocardia sp. MCCB 268]|nr:DNA-binding response regulator [Pseudonocardia cytotoxica]